MDKVYEIPSDETVAKIKSVFDIHPNDSCKAGMVINTRDDGYYITTYRMYEYVKFKEGLSSLSAYVKIAGLLGCNDGAEVDRDYEDGCPTCNHGSTYIVRLRFW